MKKINNNQFKNKENNYWNVFYRMRKKKNGMSKKKLKSQKKFRKNVNIKINLFEIIYCLI